jgi:hypothetical protein
MDVGCSQWWFAASTMTPQNYSSSAIVPHFPSNFFPTCTCNMAIAIGMHYYAHPQHLKVLKHFVYPIWMWDAVNGVWQPPVKVFPCYMLLKKLEL